MDLDAFAAIHQFIFYITHARTFAPTASPSKVKYMEHAPNCSLEYVLSQREHLVVILVSVT